MGVDNNWSDRGYPNGGWWKNQYIYKMYSALLVRSDGWKYFNCSLAYWWTGIGSTLVGWVGRMIKNRHWLWGMMIIDIIYDILMLDIWMINRYIIWWKNVLCSADGQWWRRITELNLGLLMNWKSVCRVCSWRVWVGGWTKICTDDGRW